MGYPSQTEKGVRYVSYAIILFLIVGILTAVLYVVLWPLIAMVTTLDPNTFDPNDPGFGALLGAVLAVAAMGCGIAVMALVGLILGLIGLIGVNKGKIEFGPAHAQRVDRALIMLLLGIIVPTVGSFILSFALAGSVTTTPGLGGFTPVLDVAYAAGSLVLAVVGAVLVGLFLLWSVEALTTPETRKLGVAALALGITSAAVTSVITFVLLAAVPIPTRPEDVTILFAVPGIAGQGISVASLGLWYVMYRRILERFRRGELRAAPPAPMYMPPYPPAYGPPMQPQPPPPMPPQPPQQPPTPPGP